MSIPKNKKISIQTRQRIADQMRLEELNFYGNLNEASFLARLFDLKSMKSNDRRFNNAYEDIHQHRVNNYDWDHDWLYFDPRINLMHIEDETYLRFLSETLHPSVRNDPKEIDRVLEIYNNNLASDEFEIIQTSEISGKPLYTGRQRVIGQAHFALKKAEIKKHLNTQYVSGKITLMNEAISTDTDLAIGTAKELLETVCKSILKQKGFSYDSSWTLPRLVKETANSLDFKPKEAEDPAKAEQSIKQVLSGISTVVQGLTELRNAYGTGHGKHADFKGLETKYARLLVGVVSEISILLLATNGETAELVENEDETFEARKIISVLHSVPQMKNPLANC
jgi:hypothetical protein